MQRRTFLTSFVAGAGASWFARSARAATTKKTLVLLVQRGAADGLSMVAPIADPLYRKLRPTLALDEKKVSALDARFALHPGLAPLVPFWNDRSLAIVHAVGSPDPTRSHFDAQDWLESASKSDADGWLARALRGKKDKTAVRAVAIAPTLPRVLHGDPSALAFHDVKAFKVGGAGGSFEAMYADALDEALRGAGKEAFEAMHALDAAKVKSIQPANGAKYPGGAIGKRMHQVAQLIRADLGVEVAVVDAGGWDTHVNQAQQLERRLGELGAALAAFATDLGERTKDVCVVTATEFGRTAKENGSGGTDHGHGSVMLVLGGKVKGKRVLGAWKGLASDVLFEGRDLPVTTDHRSVFAEILASHLGISDTTVFPSFTPAPLGLF